MSDRTIDEQVAAGALARAALCRMVQPKNRAKGTWAGMSVKELIDYARGELDEVEQAIANETPARVLEELGDVAACIAMAVDVAEGGCCCVAGCNGPHDPRHCPGYFVNVETHRAERCDECAVFASDDDVEAMNDAIDDLSHPRSAASCEPG